MSLATTPATVERRQEELRSWHQDVFGEGGPQNDPAGTPDSSFESVSGEMAALFEQDQASPEDIARHQDEEDLALVATICRSRQGNKFWRLFGEGDLSDYHDDSPDGVDRSAADMALCRMLAYWTPDREQID
jgi:hypothetical protein